MHDGEENDSNGEHVDLSAIVRLALLDFGCHVGLGTAVRVHKVDVLVLGEPKVGNFEVQIIVYKYVLKLEVSVSDSSSVNVVHGVEHLMQEEAASILAHRSHRLHKIEEDPALHKLHDDEDNVRDDSSRWLNHFSLVTILVHLDYSVVIKQLEDLDFVLERDKRISAISEELFSQDLDCSVFLFANELSKVDLARVALAKSLEDLVPLVEYWVWHALCVGHDLMIWFSDR